MPRVEQVLNRTGASPRDLWLSRRVNHLNSLPVLSSVITSTGYILLGMLIEKVSGISYADFPQRNIFTPLGMADSGYDDAAKVLKQRASGYEMANDQIRNADFINISVAFSAGGSTRPLKKKAKVIRCGLHSHYQNVLSIDDSLDHKPNQGHCIIRQAKADQGTY